LGVGFRIKLKENQKHSFAEASSPKAEGGPKASAANGPKARPQASGPKAEGGPNEGSKT